jgi:hypothetical protein
MTEATGLFRALRELFNREIRYSELASLNVADSGRGILRTRGREDCTGSGESQVIISPSIDSSTVYGRSFGVITIGRSGLVRRD